MKLAHRLLLKWARLLHVYLTLFGFVTLLFFAVTGFMLNHENWFLPTQITTGKIPTELLAAPENRDPIIDALRNDFGVPRNMDLETFEVLEDANAIRVAFKSNDGVAEAVLHRASGETVVTVDTDKQNRQRVTVMEGRMPMELLVADDPSKALPIVERLRKDFAVHGEVLDPPAYEKESESFSVHFKSPGYQADAVIRASDGHTTVTHQSRGINGIFLDLHRGKDSGKQWSLVVDVVSVLFVIVSATGLILWSRHCAAGHTTASRFCCWGWPSAWRSISCGCHADAISEQIPHRLIQCCNEYPRNGIFRGARRQQDLLDAANHRSRRRLAAVFPCQATGHSGNRKRSLHSDRDGS